MRGLVFSSAADGAAWYLRIMSDDWSEPVPSWIDSLKFAIQERLFQNLHGIQEVEVVYSPPGNVKIKVKRSAVRFVHDIAKQLLPVGTGVEVVADGQ